MAQKRALFLLFALLALIVGAISSDFEQSSSDESELNDSDSFATESEQDDDSASSTESETELEEETGSEISDSDEEEEAISPAIVTTTNVPSGKTVTAWHHQLAAVVSQRLSASQQKQDTILSQLRHMDKLHAALIGRYNFIVSQREKAKSFLKSTSFTKYPTHTITVPGSDHSCFNMLRRLLKNKLYMSYTEWHTMYESYLTHCKQKSPRYVYVVSHQHHAHHYFVSHVIHHHFSPIMDAEEDEDEEEDKWVPHVVGTVVHHTYDILHPAYKSYYLPPNLPHPTLPNPHWLAEYNHYMECNKRHYALEQEDEESPDYSEWLQDCHPDEHIRRLKEDINHVHLRIEKMTHRISRVHKKIQRYRRHLDEQRHKKDETSVRYYLRNILGTVKKNHEMDKEKRHCMKLRTRMVLMERIIPYNDWITAYERYVLHCPGKEFAIKVKTRSGPAVKKVKKKKAKKSKKVKKKKKISFKKIKKFVKKASGSWARVKKHFKKYVTPEALKMIKAIAKGLRRKIKAKKSKKSKKAAKEARKIDKALKIDKKKKKSGKKVSAKRKKWCVRRRKWLSRSGLKATSSLRIRMTKTLDKMCPK